jgi:DNA polymerase-3 subunit delta'
MNYEQFFSNTIGQPQAIELLIQAVAKERVAPAYLFAGPDGVGRSKVAQGLIELLFCQNYLENPEKIKSIQHRIRQRNHPDLLWVEPIYLHQGKRLSATEAAEAGLKRKAPPQIRIEQIREISQFLSRPPLETQRSVIVLEHAETMAESAANGLLKTLEEPGKATLILIAPAAESLLPTLVSRCQKIPFYRLSEEAIRQVLTQAGYEEILAQNALLAIAQGSPGTAIAAWEQLQEIPAELLTQVTQRPKTSRQALELAKEIDKNLDTQAQLWLIDYLQYCYWQQQIQDQKVHPIFIKKLEEARRYLLNYAQPRLVWECTLLLMANG